MSVLRSLKNSGEFEVRHQLREQPGFHPADVGHFKNKLLAITRNNSHFSVDVQAVTVGESIRKVCHTVPERANLIRDLLARKIPVVASAGDSLADWLISPDDLSAFVRGQRMGEFGTWISGREAAKKLNCEPATVTGLIERGLLEARNACRGWEIAEASVDEFNGLFVRLSCIAQTLGTSSRRLMRLCAANGLELYEIPCRRNGVQPYVRREAVEKIVGHANADAQKDSSKFLSGCI